MSNERDNGSKPDQYIGPLGTAAPAKDLRRHHVKSAAETDSRKISRKIMPVAALLSIVAALLLAACASASPEYVCNRMEKTEDELAAYHREHGRYPSDLASAGTASWNKDLSAEQAHSMRVLLEPKLPGKPRRKGVCGVFFLDPYFPDDSHRASGKTPADEVKTLCGIGDGEIAYASLDGGSSYMLIGGWNEGSGPIRPGVQIDSTLAAPDPLIAANDKQVAEAAEQCLERVSKIVDTKTRLNDNPANVQKQVLYFLSTNSIYDRLNQAIAPESVSSRMLPYFLAAATGSRWPTAGYCMYVSYSLGLASDLKSIAADGSRPIKVRLAATLALLKSREDKAAVSAMVDILKRNPTSDEKLSVITLLGQAKGADVALNALQPLSGSKADEHVRNSSTALINLLKGAKSLRQDWETDFSQEAEHIGLQTQLDQTGSHHPNYGFTFSASRSKFLALAKEAKDAGSKIDYASALIDAANCYVYERNYSSAMPLYREAAQSATGFDNSQFEQVRRAALANEYACAYQHHDAAVLKKIVAQLGKPPEREWLIGWVGMSLGKSIFCASTTVPSN